ncbi:MAG: MoxR family ATPase [Planctomycetota bacterium]
MIEQTSDERAVQRLADANRRIRQELRKRIVGQEGVIEQLLISLFSRGHCILTGVPGLAKTLMVASLARLLSLTFKRIQFTPDLMPADITGTEVIQENRTTGQRELVFLKGPVFANLILADEINRTPPKTQSALLESMQEYQVTVGGKRHDLELPFYVLATQNPIEQEGTYPLPEAQLDRFMFNILVSYPSAEEEMEIVRKTTVESGEEIQPVLSGAEILELQELVRRIPVSDPMIRYAMEIVRLTRVPGEELPAFVRESLAWGAGPRASQYLVLGAKARAVLHGRAYVIGEDIRAVAHPVLRHRLIMSFAAEAEGIKSDHIVDRLLETVEPAESVTLKDGKLPPVLGS